MANQVSRRFLVLGAFGAIAVGIACGGGASPTSPGGANGSASTSTCSFAVTSTTPPMFSPWGSMRTATVTTGAGCSWTATSGVSWITISSGASGTGGGTVTYAVNRNTDMASRTAAFTIAGQTVTIRQDGAAIPAAARDNYVNFGEPSDEAFHALSGWGGINLGNFPTVIDLDRTSRYQEPMNMFDAFISEANVPYVVTIRAEDGACDDSFELVVNGTSAFTYRHRQSSETYPLHKIPLGAAFFPATTVHLAFKNLSTQACGHAAIFYLRIDS